MYIIYSKEQIATIRNCASNLMKIDDIAAILDIDADELRSEIANRHTEVSKEYRKAKAQTILEFRMSELQMARNGSPQAVQLLSQFLNDMNDNEEY